MKTENKCLKQNVNFNIFKIDAIKPYGGRENVSIHSIPELQHNREDDGESIDVKVAETLRVNFSPSDITELTDWEKQLRRNPSHDQ